MATIDKPQKSTLSQYDLSWDAWLTRAYAINPEYVIYAVILVLAVVMRFWNLGDRVMSHDESLHTYYSWRLYDAGDFQHTPLMHGPVLFHIIAFFYFMFGDSDFTARIYPALLGTGIVMFPILFRRWMGKSGAVLASIGLLISPMMTYYSRYIREDIPMIFYALVMIYAFMQYIDGVKPRRLVWLWVFSGSMLLMLATKEVGFMNIAIFGSFLTVYWVLRVLQEIPIKHRQPYHPGWIPPIWQVALGHVLVIGTAVVLGFFGGE
ncbi:MAG TPA: flippase activity-associated protein Agl23, partial [Aggregatilineales bacterium]|nr:flippase activity-associated protein Agl23 [Aggregatilineales bacterium]